MWHTEHEVLCTPHGIWLLLETHLILTIVVFLQIIYLTLSYSEVASISGSVDDTIDEEFN